MTIAQKAVPLRLSRENGRQGRNRFSSFVLADDRRVLSRNVVARVKTRYARPPACDIRPLILGRVAASDRTTIVKTGRQNQQQFDWPMYDVVGGNI